MPLESDDPLYMFLNHLLALLSVYEIGPCLPGTSIPEYDGPKCWQMGSILRTVENMAQRMHTAEEELRMLREEKNMVPLGKESSQRSSDITTTLSSSMASSALGISSADGISRGQEESTLPMQTHVQDVVRICAAVARGDLSQRITRPVCGSLATQLKDAINKMVRRYYFRQKECLCTVCAGRQG